MAYIPTRPIVADDPLAYFAALAGIRITPKPSVPPLPGARVLELMYGYYTAE